MTTKILSNNRFETKQKSSNIPLNFNELYDELTIAIVGSVDASKTSTIAVITNKLLWNNPKDNLNKCLDDGNGKVRSKIMQFPHEIESGRTSSISYTPLLLKKETWSDLSKSRLISFCDLCGHQKYLKNTVSGICGSFSDFALICIDRKINPMTKEHIKLLNSLNIPYAILITKIDNMPRDQLSENIKEISKKIKKITDNKKLFFIKSDNDCLFPFNYDLHIPVILISNITGANILRLMKFLCHIPKKMNEYPSYFQVDGIYNVSGHGLVITGNCGIDIKIGDKLLMGPFSRKNLNNKISTLDYFTEVHVRSIHDNYRNSISNLLINTRGCLCIKINNEYKNQIKKGQILIKSDNNIKITNKILAEISIFKGHHTTIKNGFNALCNIGTIRTPATFKIKEEYIRSGDYTIAELTFPLPICPILDMQFIFREGLSIGYGIIKEIL
jgi:elongation factor 1-alpha